MPAIEELKIRLHELQDDLAFVSLSAQLRPRVSEIVNWDAQGEVLELARTYMEAKSFRSEGVYGPLLVRLLASFERFLRTLVSEVVEGHASRARSFDDLSPHLVSRNLVLTGKILSALDSPKDHLSFDIHALISNLASCRKGSAEFQLNSQAFSASVVGVSPFVLNKALGNVDVKNCWDSVGADARLVKHLGTKGARSTGERAQVRLDELWKWRNHLAHGGDEEPSLTERQIREAIEFVDCLGSALDAFVRKQIGPKVR